MDMSICKKCIGRILYVRMDYDVSENIYRMTVVGNRQNEYTRFSNCQCISMTKKQVKKVFTKQERKTAEFKLSGNYFKDNISHKMSSVEVNSQDCRYYMEQLVSACQAK